MNTSPLLTTKLTLPPRRTRMLDRQALRQRLDEARQQQLTILSAPAGFGKTTLLANWAATCGEKVAWISLDASENDPLLFWRYFAAACQQLQPDLERQMVPVLQHSGPLDVEALLSVVINSLAQASSPLLLILDDYHVVTTHTIHQQMTFLIEHLPAALHLMISTRADPPFPLARFPARNTLYELRTLDLRFSEEETELFLKQEARLTLTMPSQLEMIEQKLEGWPAGLHLLALSLKNRPDRLEWLVAYPHSPITREQRAKKGVLQAGDRAPDGLVRTSDGAASQHLFETVNSERSILLVFTGKQEATAVERQWSEIEALLSEGYDQMIEAYMVPRNAASWSEQEASHILHDVTGELHQRYEAEHGGLLLVRPDGYIGFWGQFGATGELHAYVRELFV